MSHTRIEEVSDSDPSEADIEEFDEREILKAINKAAPSPPSQPTASRNAPSLINSSSIPSRVDASGTQFMTAQDETKYKDFQQLYPVYFDKKRSRAQGRRVGTEDAVENPLARQIVAACTSCGLETLFEPAKTHPKDWSNPGRVKVRVKGGRNPQIKNKHHLYKIVAAYLKKNPATKEYAAKVQVPGAPLPDLSKPYPEPAIPRGWKMNNIIPYWSAAMTGGGVSDNMFKDMMAEMGGQLPGGAGGMMGGGPSGSNQGKIEEGKKKKEKKKGKA